WRRSTDRRTHAARVSQRRGLGSAPAGHRLAVLFISPAPKFWPAVDSFARRSGTPHGRRYSSIAPSRSGHPGTRVGPGRQSVAKSDGAICCALVGIRAGRTAAHATAAAPSIAVGAIWAASTPPGANTRKYCISHRACEGAVGGNRRAFLSQP